MFLKAATVVSAAGDNSCLYHSLSFLLCRENLYDKDGFIMRQQLNNYIRDNLFKVVWTSPRNSEPFCEAIRGEGLDQAPTPDLHTATKVGPSFCSRVEIRCGRLV